MVHSARSYWNQPLKLLPWHPADIPLHRRAIEDDLVYLSVSENVLLRLRIIEEGSCLFGATYVSVGAVYISTTKMGSKLELE